MGVPDSGDDIVLGHHTTPHDGSNKGRIVKPFVVGVVILILYYLPWIDHCILLLLHKSRLPLHPLALDLCLLWIGTDAAP